MPALNCALRPPNLRFQPIGYGVMLLAISDKPKVFGTLPLDILNSDHFWVSFESVELGKCPHGASQNNNFSKYHYLTNQVKFSVISWSRHSSGLHIKSTSLNSKQVSQKYRPSSCQFSLFSQSEQI